MSEWQKYKLGEVYSFSSGLSKSSDQFGYGFDFLTFKDVFNNYFLPDKLTALVNSTEKERQTCSIKRGDVFLTRTSETDDELGMSSVALKDYPNATFNGFTKRLRPLGNVEIYPEFVAYYFRSPRFRANIVGMSSITTRASLNNSMLAELPLLLPNYEEQVRIATILKCLDDKIDLLHRENKTLEAMAETLFRQWFIEEAKEDWEEKELREIVDISIGRTPPRKETKWFSTNPSDVKWLSIKDMGAGDVFLFNTSEYLTKEAVETFSIPIIPKDTVVLSFKMTVGRVGITTEEMLSNEAIAHFKFTNKTPITKEYLYLFLKTYKYETLGSTSSIVTAINSAMIKNIEVTIPDADTMKRYKNQTQPMFDKIYNNQEQINSLIHQRDGLLPKLMSGEVKI